jgi:hypothetical protein
MEGMAKNLRFYAFFAADLNLEKGYLKFVGFPFFAVMVSYIIGRFG